MAEVCLETNPFRIPDLDDDLIRLWGEERIRRAKTQEENCTLKIWQKGRSGGLAERPRASRLNGFLKKDASRVQNGTPLSNQSVDKVTAKLGKYKIDGRRNEEKEPIADFVAKKREMFLLNMSLEIKKEEIRKLEEKTRVKEEALRRSEQMLEDDAARFDAFLKENDKKAQDAIREAEKETKRKMEKVQEIKKLNQQIQGVQANINKNKDALDENLIYKDFLDGLTPPTWVEQQIDAKRDRQRRRRRDRIAKRREDWRKEQEQRLEEEEKAKIEAEAVKAGRRGSQNSRRRTNNEAQHKNSTNSVSMDLPPEPDFEDEALTSSDEEMPMYFEEPPQLLEIFSSLEDENLFLIQGTQDADQSLDDLNQSFNDGRNHIIEKTSALEQNIQHLKSGISREENILEQLEERMEQNGLKYEEDVASSLSKKVTEIYRRCGFNDPGSTPSIIFMLSDIEAKMETLISEIQGMPTAHVQNAEKIKEKERREKKRIQKQAAQERAQEERNRKAMERAMQPPKKRVGKPVMYRSHLVRRDVCKEVKEPTQEKLDELRHLT